jgi:hypothetical protein
MGLAAGAQISGSGVKAVGAYSSARSQKSSLLYQASIDDLNAQQAELSAQQEMARGDAAIAQSTARAGQIKSAQRASMAANGIDLGEGSAVDVLTTTDVLKEEDTNTLHANALRSAWGMRTQATNFKNDARMKRTSADSISPGLAAATSLLGSASSTAQSFYSMKKGT